MPKIELPVRYDEDANDLFDATGELLPFRGGNGEHIATCINSFARLSDEVERMRQHAPIIEILAERVRQVEKEGWSPEHDDEHKIEALARAAACYAFPLDINYVEDMNGKIHAAWPWDEEWDKRKKHDRRRRLIIAGALIVAELERMDRALKGEQDREVG